MSDLCQVLMECSSELDINSSIFLTTNNNNDNMYCECSGRMFNFLNNSRRYSLTSIHENYYCSFL